MKRWRSSAAGASGAPRLTKDSIFISVRELHVCTNRRVLKIRAEFRDLHGLERCRCAILARDPRGRRKAASSVFRFKQVDTTRLGKHSEARLIMWNCAPEAFCSRTEKRPYGFKPQVLKVIDLEREPEFCLRI